KRTYTSQYALNNVLPIYRKNDSDVEQIGSLRRATICAGEVKSHHDFAPDVAHRAFDEFVEIRHGFAKSEVAGDAQANGNSEGNRDRKSIRLISRLQFITY